MDFWDKSTFQAAFCKNIWARFEFAIISVFQAAFGLKALMKMAYKLLNQSEFRATQSIPMKNVSDIAEELVNLWEYADKIIEDLYHSCSAWTWEVRWIYQSTDDKYQHIGIPVPLDNTYLVVVVDILKREIMGHHILDLNYLKNNH